MYGSSGSSSRGAFTRSLPWNKNDQPLTNQTEILACDFTLIDLYLLDTAGKLARYQKTSRFVVMTDEVSSYKRRGDS